VVVQRQIRQRNDGGRSRLDRKLNLDPPGTWRVLPNSGAIFGLAVPPLA